MSEGAENSSKPAWLAPGNGSRTRARRQDKYGDGDRVAQWLQIVMQVDEAQAVYLREADTARATTTLMKQLGCSWKRAERLVYAAKLRLRREATMTSRDEARAFLRAHFRNVIKQAHERTKPVVVMVEKDRQEVEYVPDPDLRSMVEAGKALAVLEDVASQSAGATTDAQARALAALQDFMMKRNLDAPAELVADTEDK